MKIQNVKQSKKADYKSAPGEVMMGLSKLLFALLILGGLLAFFIVGGELGIGILIGCCFEGLMVYAILYGIGNLVKNTDETKHEIKTLNKKIEEFIKKQ